MEDCISHSALFLRSLIAARAAPGRGGRHVAGRAGGGGGNTAWIRVSVGEQPARGCPPLRGMCGGAPTASCLRFGDRMVLEGNLKCLPPLSLQHVVLWAETGALCGIIWRAEPGVECQPPIPLPSELGLWGEVRALPMCWVLAYGGAF